MKKPNLALMVKLGVILSLNTALSADWGYSKANGPEKWAELGYKKCSSGKSQSPINITTQATKSSKNKLAIQYHADSTHITNSGHSIELNFANQSLVSFNKNHYKLIQAHFHTPSENQINGKSFPLEMHLVHQDDTGNLLVVGVFFDEGDFHNELHHIVTNAPSNKDETKPLKNINIQEFLPEKRGYFSFAGSLTTPPCTENVQWIVLKDPLQASKEQIYALNEIMHDNARDIQPINNRTIHSID